MAKKTFDFQGYKIRLDQIAKIEPLRHLEYNQDGFFVLFMRPSKQNFKTQSEFTIWFVGKGGYKTFYSKVVKYTGWGNEKYDAKFDKNYIEFVKAWEDYHNGEGN